MLTDEQKKFLEGIDELDLLMWMENNSKRFFISAIEVEDVEFALGYDWDEDADIDLLHERACKVIRHMVKHRFKATDYIFFSDTLHEDIRDYVSHYGL